MIQFFYVKIKENIMRANFFGSTACYLLKRDKILFIKFNKKWGQVYAPIGEKMEIEETPTECLLREYIYCNRI